MLTNEFLERNALAPAARMLLSTVPTTARPFRIRPLQAGGLRDGVDGLIEVRPELFDL